MIRDWDRQKHLILALILASIVGVALFSYCAAIDHSLAFSYLIWNLVLAWVPLILSSRLIYVLAYKLWSSWEAMGLSFLWLLFLPNSFYMISDFIHLQTAPTNNIVYYAVAFTSLIYTAVALGFISLYMVHKEFLKRYSSMTVNIFIAVILAICSSAIYIGRDLRWNSWDILTNPGGVVFDISDRLIHVSDYPTVLATAGVFFLLLGGMYILAWSGIKVINSQRV